MWMTKILEMNQQKKSCQKILKVLLISDFFFDGADGETKKWFMSEVQMLKVTSNTWKTNSIRFPGTEIFFVLCRWSCTDDFLYLIPSSTWMSPKKWQFN